MHQEAIQNFGGIHHEGIHRGNFSGGQLGTIKENKRKNRTVKQKLSMI